MRADRLLALLLLLQNRGRMTAPELAAELETSVRTVYRDVEALGAAGVPVRADRGPAGGYRLVDGYRTRLTGLTDAEAGSLFLAGMPGPAGELGLGAVLATAQLKVQAALPPELAERARRAQDRFHLDAPAWFRDADPVPFLAPVAAAVWEQRVLRARYRRWRGEVHRELRPLGVVLKGGIWYVAALAEAADERNEQDSREAPDARNEQDAQREPDTREAPLPHDDAAFEGPERSSARELPIRTYRISRFLSVEPTGELFARPAGFDLAAHWTESSRRLEAALHRQTALLRLSPRGRKLLPFQFGAAGRQALDEAGPPDADGWVRVELPVETQSVAVGDLLRLGTEAEVLGPPELRRAVAGTVTALAERYAAAGPRDGAAAPAPCTSERTHP